MLTIEGKQINITRGDTGTIKIKTKTSDGYYTFSPNDVIEFKVYSKRAYQEQPVIYKSITIQEETQEVEIDLTSDDTRIGDIINKEKEYWYEVQLNGNITLIGYDDLGASIFMLLPEGSEVDE